MKKFNLIRKFAIIALISVFTVSCDDDEAKTPETIAEIAIATPGLENLVAALQRANLVSALNGTAEFTVFAPTNAAFNTFLSVNGFATLNDVPIDVLTQVLLNHVISEELPSTSLTTGYVNTLASYSDTTLNLSMFINTANNEVNINGVSSVVTADIEATNGIIHIVDAVIGIPTVVTFATADPNFSTLETALTTLTPATDFVSILSGDGPFTVFAPTNAAFAALPAIPAETVLTQVLLHHVVSGNIQSGGLTPNGNTVARSLQGNNLTITLPGTGGNIANMTDGDGNSGIGIIAVNVQAGNGVIHVINKVAIPNI